MDTQAEIYYLRARVTTLEKDMELVQLVLSEIQDLAELRVARAAKTEVDGPVEGT